MIFPLKLEPLGCLENAWTKAAKRPSKHHACSAYMGLGTKHRQKQTADLCKLHLREKYPDKLTLVEEFIAEVEGPAQNRDLTRWGHFSDIKDFKKEMLRRVEVRFESWLNS